MRWHCEVDDISLVVTHGCVKIYAVTYLSGFITPCRIPEVVLGCQQNTNTLPVAILLFMHTCQM